MIEKTFSEPEHFMAKLTLIFDNYGDSQSLTLQLGVFSSPAAAERYRKRIQSNNTQITTIMEVFKVK